MGLAFLGSTLVGPGRARDGGGSRIVLERHPRIDPAATALGASGFEVVLEADIRPALWAKLAVNCAINPVTALRGVVNGALLDDPTALRQMESAAREVGEVARALGVRLADDPVALAARMARATARNRSSMLQDAERGAPTEIEALNGAVVREAERLGIETPVNRALVEAMRRLESERGIIPGP